MSLPPETMMDLMAYADGELEGGDRARVEELLRSNEEARRVVGAMGTLGEVVRDGAAERAPASARVADGIVDGVMAAIAADSGGGKVVAIGAARASRGRFVAAGAVALVALAAGVALVMRPTSGPSVVVDDHGFSTTKLVPSVTAPSAPVPAATAVAETEAQGVDLEEAESAQGKVDVFFMPSPAAAGAVASVVVWIDDRHGGHGK